MTGYQDWRSGTIVGNALTPGNATSTQTGPAFDTLYTEGQLALIVQGTVNVGTCAVKLTECDTEGGSYTDVAVGDTATLTTAFVATAQAFNFAPTKRYIKAVFTGASSPDFTLGASFIARAKYKGNDPRL